MAFKSCTQLALLTFASVAVMGMFVKAATPICTELLGPCNLMNCKTVCRSRHSGGAGKCDITKTCKCDYPCPPKTKSPPAQAPAPAIVTPNTLNTTCHAAVGKCDPKCDLACCQNKCKVYYKGGVGHCDLQVRGKFLICNCDYPC